MTDSTPNLDTIYDKSAALGSLKDNLYNWHGANEWIFRNVNKIHGELYDHIMVMITNLGDHHNFKYYFIAAIVFALCNLVVRKLRGRAGVKGYLSVWLGVLLVMAIGYPTVGIATRTLKAHFAYERPYEKFGTKEVTVLEKQPKEKANESFPSGHSVFIMFMVMALWPVLSENLRWISSLMVLAVGWSRMAVGVHFPADIVAGFLLAYIIVSILRMLIYNTLRVIFKIHC